jgi:hypothetical protein
VLRIATTIQLRARSSVILQEIVTQNHSVRNKGIAMHKIILMMLLAVVSSSAMAEWVAIGTGDGFILYGRSVAKSFYQISFKENMIVRKNKQEIFIPLGTLKIWAKAMLYLQQISQGIGFQ